MTKRRDLQRLMKGKSNFRVIFSASQVAASLWDYGEDALADRALTMSDVDVRKIQAIAAHYEDPSYPLPLEGQRITHNHVAALAAVTYFERDVRALSRTRRRAQRTRPAKFDPAPPDPSTGIQAE